MDVRKMAYQLVVRNDIENKFRNEVAGRDCLDHFLKRHKVNSHTTESSDTSCIFSGMSYSSDRRGEEWIQCLSCNLWAHTACAVPEGEYYICYFCR
ncbi:hypothetical protein WA026_002081 [Henosepilachna vigintioctopunctata]|uniref:Zinc finger PHD-type domain-containing protein n=1 Tax=Henosepilachna vigintioctopunctata TaxID=420089 RepID=A0AAW1TSG8_9CUCU